MENKEKYIDIGILLFLAILIAFAIESHFVDGAILSLNNYIGFGLLFLVIIVKLVSAPKVKYMLFACLVLYTFNLINFTAARFYFKIGIVDVASEPVGINPIGLILLIIYWVNNRTLIKNIYSKTEAEQEAEHDKLLAFYKKKFSGCSETELAALYKHYDSYPVEAQIVLDRLIKK